MINKFNLSWLRFLVGSTSLFYIAGASILSCFIIFYFISGLLAFFILCAIIFGEFTQSTGWESLISEFLLALFYSIQDNLLFYPDVGPHRACVPSPQIYGLPFEVVYIKTRDKVSLHSYFIRHPEQKGSCVPTFVYFHGNAGNIGGRLQNCNGIYHNLQCNILLVGKVIAVIHVINKFKAIHVIFRISRLRPVERCAQRERPLHRRTCSSRLFIHSSRLGPFTNCAFRKKFGWSCCKLSMWNQFNFKVDSI